MLAYGSCISLFNQRKGRYLTAEVAGTVSVNRKTSGQWEYFTIERADTSSSDRRVRYNDLVYLKSHHGKYLSAKKIGALSWNKDQAAEWEAFRLLKRGTLEDKSFITNSSDVTILSEAHQRYVVAEVLGFANCNRKEARSRETFQVVLKDVPAVEQKPEKIVVKQQDKRASMTFIEEDSESEEECEVNDLDDAVAVLEQFQQGLKSKRMNNEMLEKKASYLQSYFTSKKLSSQELKLKNQFNELYLLYKRKNAPSPLKATTPVSSDSDHSDDDEDDSDEEEGQYMKQQQVVPTAKINITGMREVETETVLAREQKEDLEAIERDLDDLYEMMGDMKNLTQEQGYILDSVEEAIEATAETVNLGNTNVKQASGMTSMGLLKKMFSFGK
jgi:t-SNARE complex subunit (syntaxin)